MVFKPVPRGQCQPGWWVLAGLWQRLKAKMQAQSGMVQNKDSENPLQEDDASCPPPPHTHTHFNHPSVHSLLILSKLNNILFLMPPPPTYSVRGPRPIWIYLNLLLSDLSIFPQASPWSQGGIKVVIISLCPHIPCAHSLSHRPTIVLEHREVAQLKSGGSCRCI